MWMKTLGALASDECVSGVSLFSIVHAPTPPPPVNLVSVIASVGACTQSARGSMLAHSARASTDNTQARSRARTRTRASTPTSTQTNSHEHAHAQERLDTFGCVWFERSDTVWKTEDMMV